MSSRIDFLKNHQLAKNLLLINRGIEKESLRTDKFGYLSQKKHPICLGSPLTHKNITTDFSEALIELVTDCHTSKSDLLKQLYELHAFTFHCIENELLWPNSMPCQLPDANRIQIGTYGTSNIGQMKHIYRKGLSNRYGSYMQTISGIHYNFSLSDTFFEILKTLEDSNLNLQDFKSDCYFGLIRNFHRFSWFISFMLGASPIVSKNFLQNSEHKLIPVGGSADSFYTPFATSLRMGDLGYKSKAQDSLKIRYDNIDTYIADLRSALEQTFSEYEEIGLKDEHENYKQLNTNILQIENEFYSDIRPKRTTNIGETPTKALEKRGVEYVEIRSIDLNPFVACGIDEDTIDLLDIFLIYCLMSDSSKLDEIEQINISTNYLNTVYKGRDPKLRLKGKNGNAYLLDLANALVENMKPIAKVLDTLNNNNSYEKVLTKSSDCVKNNSLLPSAKIVNLLKENNQTFQELNLTKAQEYSDYFKKFKLTQNEFNAMTLESNESIKKQAEIEQNDTLSFESFLNLF